MQKVAASSREAYNEVKRKGKDKVIQDLVYSALLRLPNHMGTASDITVQLTRNINNMLDYADVNRRVSELVEDDRIRIISEKGGKTFRRNKCRIYKAIIKDDVGEPVSNSQGNLFS